MSFVKKNWQDQSVLIAGLGSIGQRHTRLLHASGVKTIYVCDTMSAAVQKTVDTYPGVIAVDSYDAGLERKPDAVFILTPPKLHVPMAIQAAKQGCHIFCEKPISDDMTGIGALRKAIEETGVLFAVGLCFRYHAGVRKLKEIVDSGRIGRPIHIRAFMGENFPSVRPDYKTLFSAQYSGAFDLIHDLDLAVWFANQPVKRQSVVYGHFSDIGIQAPDLAEFLIEFENQCLANVHLDFYTNPQTRKFTVTGTRGMARVEFASWTKYTVSVWTQETGWESMTRATERDCMFIDEDLAFLKAISGEDTCVYGIDEGCKALALVDQALHSDRPV
jgi:predicted dehydrogenase